MKVNFFEKPYPHYIIDDFLTPRAAKEVLQEVIDLEPFYSEAKVTSDNLNVDPKHCKDCKINHETNRNMVRDNQTAYLDEVFKNNRQDSKTLTYLHHRILEEDFIRLMDHATSIYPIFNQLNTSSTLISRYGKCEFYGWHTDTIHEKIEQRVITLSYYVNKEPCHFEGGNLLLLDEDGKTIKSIEPKHNRAVIFISRTALHSVEYVNLANKNWDEGRFSIQFWLGFNSTFKFR